MANEEQRDSGERDVRDAARHAAIEEALRRVHEMARELGEDIAFARRALVRAERRLNELRQVADDVAPYLAEFAELPYLPSVGDAESKQPGMAELAELAGTEDTPPLLGGGQEPSQ